VVQVPGDANQLLSGTLKAGDHVDVVANWQFPEGSGHHVSRIILRDLLVLSAPDATTISSHISAGPSSALLAVQLQVTDTQEPKLYWMAQNGNWTLELRPTTHAADVGKNLEDSGTELGANKAQAVNDLRQAALAVGQ
jgi:Flp pilus assembly protein RcpC/CpaB